MLPPHGAWVTEASWESVKSVIHLKIGTCICAVLTVDAVGIGEINYFFDSANFRTMGLSRVRLHGKQPWLARKIYCKVNKLFVIND